MNRRSFLPPVEYREKKLDWETTPSPNGRMATVTSTQKPKPVEYSPEIRVEYAGSSSVMAQVSWSNPDTKAALGRLFGLKSNERLCAIVVTEHGLKAEIGSR